MGIVRTRSRQIDACDNKIKSHRKDMKSFKKVILVEVIKSKQDRDG